MCDLFVSHNARPRLGDLKTLETFVLRASLKLKIHGMSMAMFTILRRHYSQLRVFTPRSSILVSHTTVYLETSDQLN